MNKTILTQQIIMNYQHYLYQEEKSQATIEKYMRDIQHFYNALPHEKVLNKEVTVYYKNSLIGEYKVSSINSKLAAINSLLDYMQLTDCKVKRYKIQSQASLESKELSKTEYQRLLKVAKAKHNEKLYMLLQTICATGIRVSEVKYITVEAVKKQRTIIQNKGKTREIIIPKQLKILLLRYIKQQNIRTGVIFITKNKTALNRSNIWRMMKSLSEEANVRREKVFPHNLRHLFALSFYQIEKDIVRLADILGHSHIETTRIYTRTSQYSYERIFRKMNLLDYLSS